MSEAAVSVQGLSKEYRLGSVNHGLLYRDLQSWWARLHGHEDPNAPVQENDLRALPAEGENERFLALDDVSFELREGETLGIVGSNGAGKSTLLKILSRVTAPTAGAVRIRGRLTSLLEIGTGFHPELTGRENIYLNGAILGMSKNEIRRKFDEIAAFAEIDRFLDTPVKRYSSGMYVRLAFSIAAHLEPEILIVDEVLSVGDASFQRKCIGKMNADNREGRTVIFVSHGMAQVRALCQRAILLAKGKVVADGPSAEVIETYLQLAGVTGSEEAEITWPRHADAPGCAEFRLTGIRLLNEQGKVQSVFHSGVEIAVEVRYYLPDPIKGMRLILEFTNAEGVVAFSSTDHASRDPDTPAGEYVSRCTIPKDLLNAGRYYVALHVGQPSVKVLLMMRQFLSFNIEFATQHGSMVMEKWSGAVAPRLSWETVAIAGPRGGY